MDWKQERAVHCPDSNCKGMLLQSDFYHEEKCSDCGKYWISITQWHDVSERFRVGGFGAEAKE